MHSQEWALVLLEATRHWSCGSAAATTMLRLRCDSAWCGRRGAVSLLLVVLIVMVGTARLLARDANPTPFSRNGARGSRPTNGPVVLFGYTEKEKFVAFLRL